jgi:hypothetical protein
MRLGVISGRQLGQAINWTTLGPPLEDALAALPGSTLVLPPPLRRGNLRAARPGWLAAIRTVRRCDVVFWIQGHLRPETAVWATAYMHPLARRSTMIYDAFEPGIDPIGRIADAQRLLVTFVNFREAAQALAARFPRSRFEWLPFGFDGDVFRDLGLRRDIYAYWMGRRHEPLHERVKEHCSRRGLTYRYTQRAGEFADPHDLNRVIARSRYFVVTPTNLDNPARSGSFSPFVMRYLEGLAAGSRLLGVLPNREEYGALLPFEAIVECAADGSDLEGVLDEADADPDAEAKREEACDLVHREHRWERRARTIHDRLSQLMDAEDAAA